MIATDAAGQQNMQLGMDSEFSRTLKRVFLERRPRRILETGTHFGTGSTRIIGQAIREAGLVDTQFISIEVHPDYFRQAQENIRAANTPVELRNGLSIPRRLLPTQKDIRRDYLDKVDPAVFVDHPEGVRVENYFAETDFPDAPDDLLGHALRAWNGEVDFLLLDSAGHLGFIEYQYALAQIKSPCTLMLDDTRHVKHHRSVQRMKTDRRFRIESDSGEKFGYVLAFFTPEARCRGVWSIANWFSIRATGPG